MTLSLRASYTNFNFDRYPALRREAFAEDDIAMRAYRERQDAAEKAAAEAAAGGPAALQAPLTVSKPLRLKPAAP